MSPWEVIHKFSKYDARKTNSNKVPADEAKSLPLVVRWQGEQSMRLTYYVILFTAT